MGKLVLSDFGTMFRGLSSSDHTSTVLLLLLMTLCVGNHGSEVGGTFKEVLGMSPVTASLKQNGGGGESGLVLNGGKPGIESHGNVTILAGQRGELRCRTINLANYTVSQGKLLGVMSKG